MACPGPPRTNASIASTASAGPSNTHSTVPSAVFVGRAGDAPALGLPAGRVAEEDSLHTAVCDHPSADGTHADTVER